MNIKYEKFEYSKMCVLVSLAGEIYSGYRVRRERWRKVRCTMVSHWHDKWQHRKKVMEETKTGNNIFEYLLLYLITIC